MSAGTDIAAEVAAALAEAGEATGQGRVTAYIARKGAPGGTATNPTPGAKTYHACTVIYDQWSGQQIDGEVIRMTDQKVLCSISDVVPQIGDGFALTDGGETKAIVAPLERLSPGGVDIMYTLNVRG